MSMFDAVVLSIIQGLTEFIPVSSSGHLALGHWLLGIGAETEDMLPLEFVVLVHAGTLLAVVVHYRSDLLMMIRDLFRPDLAEDEAEGCPWGRRLILLLVVATLPAILAVLFEDHVEQLMNTPWAVGVALLVTGTALLVSERLGKLVKPERSTTPLDALLVGVAQTVAIFPGISRSGSTISAGLGLGFHREWATRFAFLMSVPAILGGTLYKLKDLIEQGMAGDFWIYTVSFVVSAVTGYFAIRVVIAAVQSRNLKWIAVYCYAVGLIAIIASLSGLV